MGKWRRETCKGRVVIVPPDELQLWTVERLRELPEFAGDGDNTVYIILPDNGRGVTAIRPTAISCAPEVKHLALPQTLAKVLQ